MRLADERGRPRISSVADEVSRAGKTSIRLQADDARIEGTQFVPSPPPAIPKSDGAPPKPKVPTEGEAKHLKRLAGRVRNPAPVKSAIMYQRHY